MNAMTGNGERIDTYVHEGVDLAALAGECGMWIWRCRVCGQEELIRQGAGPKPCFRCDLMSGAFQRRLDEIARLSKEKRAREQPVGEAR